MYPLSLENQYQQFFLKEFRRLALPYTNAIIKQLRQEIKADSDDAVRADSVTGMMMFISDLKEEYGNKIDSKVLEGKIQKNFKLLDSWSRDKTNEAMGKIYARMNTPQAPSVTGRPTPKGKSGELWMQTINLRGNLNEGLIDDAVKKNVSLIDKAYKEHFDKMGDAVKDGILSGKGSRAIADDLMKITGVDESKARFWARDQASKFFGETTRIRQQGAGIPGYVWRSVGGLRTRDTHLALEGTYHDWNNPPMVQSGKNIRPLHPGEDYNCRCWAEPAMGLEAADREYAEPSNDDFFEKIRPGTEPAKWSDKEGIRQRMVIDIDNPALKQNVETAIDEIEKVIGIDTKLIKRAITVTEIPAGSPKSSVYGIFSGQSDVIMLNPKSEFPASTFIHEFMHWLDPNVLKNSPAKTSLLDVIKTSSSYKNLEREITKKSLTKERRNYLKYLMSDREILSRSFEQYIIDYKSSNQQLKDQMSNKKGRNNLGFWLDEDIKRIYVFFDALFIKTGLFK